jgi:hypothetical protein
MSVSSATSERSFSAMRRVKSYLRSTIGDELLSNLSLMHIHRHVQVKHGVNGYFSVVRWVVCRIIRSVHLYYIHYRFNHGTYLHAYSSRKVKQVVSNEERFFLCASYLNPASLLNITPEIVDRLCNAYQRDLPRKKILCMRLSVGKSGGKSTCKCQCTCICICDKLDTRSSPIVDLM